MGRAAIVSFRLGMADGVSVESGTWTAAFRRLGWEITRVAGGGPRHAVDVRIPELGLGATGPFDRRALERALERALRRADLAIVENVLSLPLNPRAACALSVVLAGRPAILHHHDLPWQRPAFAHHPAPPDDPAWRHVTINARSATDLAARGIDAVTIYNVCDSDVANGDRARTRSALGIREGEKLVLQPTRALLRKNVPAGLDLTKALGAAYWLTGPAEEDYGPECRRLVAAARRGGTTVHRGLRRLGPRARVSDAYAASDLVVLPSTWEGFGNPAIESALARKPLAIGPYPVAGELRAFGFEWFDCDDPERIAQWLAEPDAGLLDHNQDVARRHFGVDRLDRQLRALLGGMGLA